MTDENMITIEEKAREMADELISMFTREQQAQVWLLVKKRLIEDCEMKKAAEKEAQGAFKKMR
jgi:hypothetical protein